MEIKGGELFKIESIPIPNELFGKIRNNGAIRSIYPHIDTLIARRNNPNLSTIISGNFVLDWVFESWVSIRSINTFMKASSFNFYEYYYTINTVLGPTPPPVRLPPELNASVSLSGGNGNIEFINFDNMTNHKIGDFEQRFDVLTSQERPDLIDNPIDLISETQDFPLNFLRGQQAPVPVIRPATSTPPKIYYIASNLDSHYSDTVNILNPTRQNPIFNITTINPYYETEKKNYYFAFLKVFMQCSNYDIVFINSGITYNVTGQDLPVIFDRLIHDMINHFSIQKNLTIIVSAGNANINIDSLLTEAQFNYLRNGIKAIVVGAISGTAFDSNSASNIVDCYAETPINGFGQSSAASASITRLVAKMQLHAMLTKNKYLKCEDVKNILKSNTGIPYKTVNRINCKIPTLTTTQAIINRYSW